jgi:hypothetical protein
VARWQKFHSKRRKIDNLFNMLTPDKDGTNDKDGAKWKDGVEFVRV